MMENILERQDMVHRIELLARDKGIPLDFNTGIVTLSPENAKPVTFDWTGTSEVRNTLEWLQSQPKQERL